TSSTATCGGFGGLTFIGISALTLDTEQVTNNVYVTDTTQSTQVTINDAGRNSGVAVGGGPLPGSMDQILGPVVVNGQPGQGDVLFLFDIFAAAGRTYTIGSHKVQRSGAGLVSYNNALDHLNVICTDLDDSITLESQPAFGVTVAGR